MATRDERDTDGSHAAREPGPTEDYPQPGALDDEVAQPFPDGRDTAAMAAERDELDRLLGGMTSENADDTMVDDVVGNECW